MRWRAAPVVGGFVTLDGDGSLTGVHATEAAFRTHLRRWGIPGYAYAMAQYVGQGIWVTLDIEPPIRPHPCPVCGVPARRRHKTGCKQAQIAADLRRPRSKGAASA